MAFMLVLLLLTLAHHGSGGELDEHQGSGGELDGHPDLWPGHLEPFGSKQKISDVEEFFEWPNPEEFFRDFVNGSRPAVFKGLAKRSPAYRIWSDGYLRDHAGSESFLVYVEPEKKENRTKLGKEITFKKFIEIYHNESIYMVHGVPKHVQKDVLIPAPLRCESTRNLLLDAVTWFSSGGTKSVVHHDDLDNINCLLRGTKQLIFVDNKRFGKYVPLEQGYSPIDVEHVDYIKYPSLRNVEYMRAVMEEGDCLFIPFAWIHQVNSKANPAGQNIAVNIWFKHSNQHQPEGCEIAPEQATLDKFTFPSFEKNQADIEGREYNETFIQIKERYDSYLEQTDKQRFNLKRFYKLLIMDEEMLGLLADEEAASKKIKLAVKKVFNVLDVTKNNIYDAEDYGYVEEKKIHGEFEKVLTETHTQLVQEIRMLAKEDEDTQGEPPKNASESHTIDEL